MAKNIVICCDGTGNQLDETYSNVVKIYSVIRKIPNEQVVYYDPGVGTLPHDNLVFPFMRKLKTWISLGLGVGLEDNVSEAYSYLMQNYEPGDRIYLFGFSRGAYTVRVLAGMIKELGLLDKNCQNLIPYAWTYYRECYREDLKKISKNFKAYFSRKIAIHFVGVWDTVSSIGLLTGQKSYPHTRNNDAILNLRHAIAIDERRRFYRQNLFENIADNKNMKQVWFAGVHSDVGGSYPLNESGLAQITLKWMVREAERAGLTMDGSMVNDVIPKTATNDISAPDSLAPMHDSLTGFWKFLEYFPKRDRVTGKMKLPRGQWRRIFVGPGNQAIRPTLHASVIERLEKDRAYRPQNLAGKTTQDFEKED